jgi:hypothetical protein
MLAIVSSCREFRREDKKREADEMSTLLTTVTAVEDNVLDTLHTTEDAVLRAARLLAEELEPVIKRVPEVPVGGFLPAPAEVVDHSLAFVDRLWTNLREFTDQLVEVMPIRREAPTHRTVKPSAKPQAA